MSAGHSTHKPLEPHMHHDCGSGSFAACVAVHELQVSVAILYQTNSNATESEWWLTHVDNLEARRQRLILNALVAVACNFSVNGSCVRVRPRCMHRNLVHEY